MFDPYLEDNQCLMTFSVHPITQFYFWDVFNKFCTKSIAAALCSSSVHLSIFIAS